MTKKRIQRIVFIAILIALASIGLNLIWNAFEENLLYSFSPTQVLNNEAPAEQTIRLAGMVKEGSLINGTDLLVEFTLTDFLNEVTVQYRGITPDLFGEGQGVVVQGMMRDDIFYANENGLLAKHDENYMPPEVADILMNQ